MGLPLSKPGTSVLFRILVSLAGSKTARKIVNSYVGAAGALASRLGHDFVATVDFHPLFDAKLRMHLFSPDILFVLEVISQRSYDRFCGLREGDIVVDCGAYIGEFTTYASRRVGKKGRGYSFEPNPESFA